MRALRATLVVGVCIALCSASKANEGIELQGPNCDLTVPPNPAAKTALPGTFLAVYPPSVTKPYTGCRVTWWLVGEEVLWRAVVLFDRGRLEAYALIKPAPGGTRETRCQYDGQVVVARFDVRGGAESNCPAADTLELND